MVLPGTQELEDADVNHKIPCEEEIRASAYDDESTVTAQLLST